MDAAGLSRLSRRNKRHKAAEKSSYGDLVAAIWQADDEGMQQVDIVRAVGISRERVRQICAPEYRAKHGGASPRRDL